MLGGDLNLGCFMNFIAPKNEGTSSILDFIPISLVGGIYKIVWKVLFAYTKKVSLLIMLSPKNEGTSSVMNFRPISLVGSIFKILFKVRSNKFKRFRSTLKFTALFLGGLGLGDRGEMG